ncbi:MAG: transcription termination factor NusA [bacterium]|nr:transcription termination factor NusA [bacterium]
MNNPIASAIKQVCDEKNIPQEYVIEALEFALAAAYRKDFGEKNQNIKAEFDIQTGDSRIFDVKTVVRDFSPEELEDQLAKVTEHRVEDKADKQDEAEEEKRFNPKTDIMISDAKILREDSDVGEVIKTELPVNEEYGRMAAQTAKQVIIQKLREAERDLIFDEFQDRQDTLIMATVQRKETSRVLLDIGRGTAIMPNEELSPRERYMPGDRIKVYVVSVTRGTRGPEIIVSRSHENLLRKIFETEIPEVESGAIEIKAVARDVGERAKVAVVAYQENIDPIGSCIGQRGSRIQTIIAELGGEKVDIIQYDDDVSIFIMNALSPAKISRIELDQENHRARVFVKEDQLSLAIGKGGQNVRLASQLTHWNIEVVSEQEGVGQESKDEEMADNKEENSDEDLDTPENLAEILTGSEDDK